VMLAQIQSPLPNARSVNADLPPSVETALIRALAKEPADRFPDCSEFVSALVGQSSPSLVPVTAGAVPKPMAAVHAAVPFPKPAIVPPPTHSSQRSLRRPALIGAVVLVVLLALGGAAYGLNSASKRSAQSTAAGGLSHGSLIYDAKLSSAAWGSDSVPSPDPAGSGSVGYGGSSIDIRILKDGANFSGEFDAPALKEYVSQLVFKVDAGSDFEMNWRVRGSGPTEAAEVGLNIQVAQEVMTLFLAPSSGSNQALAPTLAVKGMQSGRTVDLGIVVKGTAISIYLDGVRVAQSTETSSTGAATPGFYMDGKSGALHIISLRYYALP
jgi:hypothetical protein